jgi:hypothetical protein
VNKHLCGKDPEKQRLYRALAGNLDDIHDLLRIPGTPESEEDKMWANLFVDLCEFRRGICPPAKKPFLPYGIPILSPGDQLFKEKLASSNSEDERVFFFHLAYCNSRAVLHSTAVGYDAVKRCCAAGYVAAARTYRAAVGLPAPPDEVAAAIAEYKAGNPRVHRDLFLRRLKDQLNVGLTEKTMWVFFCEDLDEDAEAVSKEWLESKSNNRQSPIDDDSEEAPEVTFWRQIFELFALAKAKSGDRRRCKEIRKLCTKVFGTICAIADDEQKRADCTFLAHATKRVVDAFAGCYEK